MTQTVRQRGSMSDNPPELIAIDHDDYHAKHCGLTSDGRQVFMTTPFDPAIGGKEGGEFVALYFFDGNGVLLEARIESFGPRASCDFAARDKLYETWLNQLGDVTFQRIKIAPFAIERFGVTFGFVLRIPEDEDDVWAVELQPGNYMAFFEPWDSGDYDT